MTRLARWWRLQTDPATRRAYYDQVGHHPPAPLIVAALGWPWLWHLDRQENR